MNYKVRGKCIKKINYTKLFFIFKIKWYVFCKYTDQWFEVIVRIVFVTLSLFFMYYLGYCLNNI